jgi:hypothetical protein
MRVLLASGGTLLRSETLRAQALILVVLSLDRELARAAVALREEGREVAVIHVAPDSFTSAPPTVESRNLALSLVSAGVPCLTVQRDDDLASVLASPRRDGLHARPG